MIVNAGYRGKVGAAVPKFTYTGTYNQRDDGVIELLTSGTITFLNPTVIDIFCVGGGGAGSNVSGTKGHLGAPGGGGGYTQTALKQKVTGSYAITIGAGGDSASDNITDRHGKPTSFDTVLTADGGKCETPFSSEDFKGGNGGSGGGGGVTSNSDYGMGGSDGNDGETGYPVNSSHAGGIGQASTTREFGEQTGKLYSGGGGGGRYLKGSTAVVSPGGNGGGGSGALVYSSESSKAATAGIANTGGGGGGGARGDLFQPKSEPGASGGSGICCFRAAK